MTNEELRAVVDKFSHDMQRDQGYAYVTGYVTSLLGSILSGWYGENLEEIKEQLLKLHLIKSENNT